MDVAMLQTMHFVFGGQIYNDLTYFDTHLEIATSVDEILKQGTTGT